MSRKIILYSRDNCPLCDEARSLLQLFGAAVEERDIESRDEWLCDYALMIPVVVIGGIELYGPDINYERLDAELG